MSTQRGRRCVRCASIADHAGHRCSLALERGPPHFARREEWLPHQLGRRSTRGAGPRADRLPNVFGPLRFFFGRYGPTVTVGLGVVATRWKACILPPVAAILRWSVVTPLLPSVCVSNILLSNIFGSSFSGCG